MASSLRSWMASCPFQNIWRLWFRSDLSEGQRRCASLASQIASAKEAVESILGARNISLAKEAGNVPNELIQVQVAVHEKTKLSRRSDSQLSSVKEALKAFGLDKASSINVRVALAMVAEASIKRSQTRSASTGSSGLTGSPKLPVRDKFLFAVVVCRLRK
eukprot:5322069-Amphidinium_carterae.1